MALNLKQQFHLKEIFRSRVTFDESERKLYGHDIAALPSLIRPILGDTVPDAVVQPENEEELPAMGVSCRLNVE